MWRRTSLIVTFMLVAAIAGAQTTPAAPKPPAAPKAPVASLAPVIAPDIEQKLEALGVTIDGQAMALALDAASRSLEEVGRSFDPAVLSAFQDPMIVKAQPYMLLSEDADYERGISSLDSGRYDRAVEAFDKVIAKGGKKTEGAMYWKAYALGRLGKRDEAIHTIDDLQKKFPSSRWTNDAKALLIDLRQASGQPVSPEKAGDEELKLIALNGIMASDPDRAIPMVEQLLTGSASPKLKERALFVLAQSASPRAKTLLAEMAKGKGNPDLQLKALDYLGVFGGGPDVPLLVEVYKSTSDVDVKKRVIRSLGMTGRRGVVFPSFAVDFPAMDSIEMDEARVAVERARTDVERSRVQVEAERVRVSPLRATGGGNGNVVSMQPSAASTEREKAREAKAKEAAEALWQLYSTEPAVELKREILVNLRITDRLFAVAKSDAVADLRRAAVQGLQFDRSLKTAEAMLGMYREEKDPGVKRQMLGYLMATSSAATLVQMARQETDPALRKQIVERLSTMKDKEAVDYMLEILKK